MSFAAKVLAHRQLRRHHLVALVFLFLAFVWGAMWIATYFEVHALLDKAIEDARAKGAQVDYARRYTNGSFFSVHVHYDALSLAAQNGAALRAGEAVIYAPLWSGKSLTAKIRKGVEGSVLGTSFLAESIKIGVDVPEKDVADYTQTGLSFWVHPYVVTVKNDTPLPLGDRIDEISGNFRLMGPVPDFSDKESLAKWTQASGVLELDRFFLRWGPVVVTGNGTFGLDPTLQPEGAFSGRIEGMEAMVAALTRSGTLDEQRASLLRSSLHVLARPLGASDASAQVVPVTLQSGGLFIGPVKLATIPTFAW